MIPVVICPVLNRVELLYKMIDSIDVPVERIVIIDNGCVTDPEVDIDAIRLPHNIGVSASWNLGMKVTPTAPWWLVVASDVEFGAGDLEHVAEVVDPDSASMYNILGMSAFAVTLETIKTVGYFDENFHPAYDEDLDYWRRCELAGVPTVEVGFTGTHVGSATIYADPVLRANNGWTHPANDRYYERKWGGPKQGGETFSTPFDRNGHQGDWRLEAERLRYQAWPRR